MNIFINEHDRQVAFRAAISNIAKLHGIADVDFRSTYELYHDVVGVNSPLLPELDRYLEAYDAWFAFYSERKAVEQKSGMEYDLNDKEKAELSTLIVARTTTLSELENKYQSLRR